MMKNKNRIDSIQVQHFLYEKRMSKEKHTYIKKNFVLFFLSIIIDMLIVLREGMRFFLLICYVLDTTKKNEDGRKCEQVIQLICTAY